MIAIGVGDADVHELKQIATPPYDSSVYHVKDYDAIKGIQTVLAAKLCEGDSKLANALVYIFKNQLSFRNLTFHIL